MSTSFTVFPGFSADVSLSNMFGLEAWVPKRERQQLMLALNGTLVRPPTYHINGGSEAVIEETIRRLIEDSKVRYPLHRILLMANSVDVLSSGRSESAPSRFWVSVSVVAAKPGNVMVYDGVSFVKQ